MQSSEAYFRAIPWCADLLSAPDTVIFTPSFRSDTDSEVPGLPASQDTLMRTSLNTRDTVPHCLGFHSEPAHDTSAPRLLVNSTSLLFATGSGVRGFHGSGHGGFVAVLADDAMGALLYQNTSLQLRRRREDPAWKPPAGVVGDIADRSYATVKVDVRLQRPLPAPGVVVATASVAGIDGRKLAIDVVIRDGGGRDIATCKGLWVSLRSGKM